MAHFNKHDLEMAEVELIELNTVVLADRLRCWMHIKRKCIYIYDWSRLECFVHCIFVQCMMIKVLKSH